MVTRKQTQPEPAASGKEPEKKKSGNKKPGKVDPSSTSVSEFRGAYRKHSTPKATRKFVEKFVKRPATLPDCFMFGNASNKTPTGHPEVPRKSANIMRKLGKVQESESKESAKEEEKEESFEEDERSTGSEQVKRSSRKVDHSKRGEHREPTKAQLSARQFLSRKLPTFSGNLEEWPMFISSYETSTKACGFSNVENLARLQEYLKGEALEAVRGRLLLPKSVPNIIETLRMLYGRPERLLNMLLAKVHNTAPPKADRLVTFIGFEVVVQQLADHLEATGLTTHLVNPMLIQELTEKLPAGTQLDWTQVKSWHTENHPELRNMDLERAKRRPERMKERIPCRICGGLNHRIRNCDKFRKLSLVERWEAVRKWQLCQLCLNEHRAANCKLSFRCDIEGCKDRHNPLLHAVRSSTSSNCNIHSSQPKSSVIFRMIPVTLYCGKFAVDTIAFRDEGSSYTLVEKELVCRLGINGATQPLRVTWTAGVSRLEKYSQCVNFRISAKGSAQRFLIKGAHTVESLKLPTHSLPLSEIVKQYDHLRGLPIADIRSATPRILIGLKDIHLYAPIESKIGRPEEPIAVRSKLGWTIYGPMEAVTTSSGIVGYHTCSTVTNQELHDLLKSYYTLEESGISVALLPEPEEDRRAKDILKKTTKRISDCFETYLLWKEDNPEFLDSYLMAVKRLKCLENRLRKNPELYNKVRTTIADYLAKEYAHKATSSELAAFDSNKVWHVPLNFVYNPKKEKFRLVWDARAEVRGFSLNSKLLKGPDMLTALPAVISKFREREIGFGADIKEMYHQLRIRDEDKRVQRFLFRNDSSAKPDVYVMDVATFGSTSLPCSAQYVKNINAKEYAGQFPAAAKAIIENHYVDDYFDSADTIEEAVERAKDVRYVHSKGGFELRNWVSNSDEFLVALGERKANQCVRFSEDKESGSERVLGIVWSPASDEFSFFTTLRGDLTPFLSGERLPTKRIVMSCVMRFFDPLGLLTNFTFYGKLLIQDLWRSGCEWDQQIDSDCAEKSCSVDYGSLQLHTFTDVSQHAYGTAVYLRVKTTEGPICSLGLSKSKVSPLQHMSIPRLELQAAVETTIHVVRFENGVVMDTLRPSPIQAIRGIQDR
ncbi:uncharacterized protein LOC131434131 [Malaya genurostris]|uniref:uncharacterized protein LOC131434131 n=1 Tax=Malaya genurostris TaxID=325434 RepID=UPI0026F3EDC0|nr:uncharacterized protein LOC131434131 [Malaya genurostris]